MTQYQIDIAPVAQKGIEDFYLYIAEDSPANAERWYFAIYERINTLTSFPTRNPVADESYFYNFEIRNLIFGGYRVLYRIKKNIVQILHVKHGKMERKPFS